MKNKGFTLVEVLMGLFILALVSVTILPIINASFLNFNKQKVKAEMIYNSEMAMERLKAYNLNSKEDFLIFDKPVKEIIELFNQEEDIVLELVDNNFKLKIEKSNKSDLLWYVIVKVDNLNGRLDEYVELKGYIPKI